MASPFHKKQTSRQLARSIPFIGCRVSASASQSPGSGADIAILFDTEQADTDGFHSVLTNTSRFTIPPGLEGYYAGNVFVQWNNTSGGQRIISANGPGGNLAKTWSLGNGTYFVYMNVSFGGVYCVPGDFIEFYAFHDAVTSFGGAVPTRAAIWRTGA